MIKDKTADEALRELRRGASPPGYREKSLKIHGNICARCMREFTGKNLKLLTVHHKDGDPNNNPPDGSNWENLCVYCHDEEHSRELLGDYVDGGKGSGRVENELVHSTKDSTGGGAFGDLLKAALKK